MIAEADSTVSIAPTTKGWRLSLGRRQQMAEESAPDSLLPTHTHRHRTPLEERLFRKEIQDNRHSLQKLGEAAIHFCYPSGVYRPEFLNWLQMENVASATCDSGLASRRSNPFLLPRLVDTSARSAIEFEAWLSGLAALLAVRKAAPQTIPAAAGRVSRNSDAAQLVLVKDDGRE